jgi:hypothetical protein
MRSQVFLAQLLVSQSGQFMPWRDDCTDVAAQHIRKNWDAAQTCTGKETGDKRAG